MPFLAQLAGGGLGLSLGDVELRTGGLRSDGWAAVMRSSVLLAWRSFDGRQASPRFSARGRSTRDKPDDDLKGFLVFEYERDRRYALFSLIICRKKSRNVA